MAEEIIPIEKVKPGTVLGQDILDPKTKEVIYARGIRLSATMINNILSLDYLEIAITDEANATQDGPKLPTKRYKIGDYICFQGEMAERIYVLKSGVLQIIATENTPPLDSLDKAKLYVNEHGKIITTIKGANTKFGEMAAILNGVRNASIKCLTETEVLEIPTNEKTFKRTLLNNYQLGISLCSSLAVRLRKVRKSVDEIEKLYSALITKMQGYREVYTKVYSSLRKKKENNPNLEWLNKIVKEAADLPPLSNTQAIRREEVERKFQEFDFREDSLPTELESYLGINTYLCKEGEPQTEFFILKKGKIETIINDYRVNLYSTPGQMIHFLDPLQNPTRFMGKYPDTLKCISPVRCFRIQISKFDDTCRFHPKLALFLCKALSHYIIHENDYLLRLQAKFEESMNKVAVGDNNFRRAYKKFSRILEKFTKEENLTRQELELAKNVMGMIDRDFALFKEELSRIHIRSLGA